MGDNVAITAGSGTLISTDDVGGGLQVQRVKPVWGVDGTATDTSASNPLPVTIVTSSVGSLVASETGSVASGQASIALAISLGYSFDGTNWTRVGATTFFSADLDETEEDIKTTSGRLYGYAFGNLHATAQRFLHFYNATAATAVVGTTPDLFAVMLPPAASGHIWFGEMGPAFATALCAAATTGLTGAGAPGANEVILAAWVK